MSPHTPPPHPLPPPPPTPGTERVRLDAAAILDGVGTAIGPGASLLLDLRPGAPARVLALGPPPRVDAHPAATAARRVDLTNHLLIPGLVNAHTHLDLTHIGPRPHAPADGFVAWVDMVRRQRRLDEPGIARSVRAGVDLLRRGGVVAVGDIAGAAGGKPTLAPWHALADTRLLGVSFLEFFAIGRGMAPALDRLDAVLAQAAHATPGPSPRAGAIRLGLQPHAPYSVDRRAYHRALALAGPDRPVCTHLAETADEREFVAHARGPKRDFLERIGVWDDSAADEIGRGLSPIAHLEPVLRAAADAGRPMLVAHANDASDDDLAILARTRTSVAFCARASAYFDAPSTLGPHRYRDMLAAGINVCLGTDSAINLPSTQVAARGLGVLDDMRLLLHRDGTDPLSLLAMGTTHGARALGLDPACFVWPRSNGSAMDPARAPAIAGIVALPAPRGLDPVAAWRTALQSDSTPRILVDAAGWVPA